MFSLVKLLNCKFKVKIYIILVLPSSAVLKPAQAGLVVSYFMSIVIYHVLSQVILFLFVFPVLRHKTMFRVFAGVSALYSVCLCLLKLPSLIVHFLSVPFI